MRLTSLAIVGTVLVACGSSQKPSAEPTPLPPQQSSADASAPSAQTSRPKKSAMEEQHEQYVQSCRKSDDLDAFCTCGWNVFTKLVTEDQLQKGLTATRLAEVSEQTGSQCADKLPERAVHESFVNACVAEEDDTTPFCECFYSELRKKWSHSALARPDVARKPEFAQSAIAITRGTTCSSKLPEEAVKKPFLKGCSKNDPTLDKFCACGWKELRSVMTPAEIRMEGSVTTPEFKKGMERVVKQCTKLKPATPAAKK